MAGMQLRSFLMEVARNSHRPPKAFFFEMAPWQLGNNGKQQAQITLDPIMEEDGLDSVKIHSSGSVAEPSTSSSSSSSSSSTYFFQDFQKGAFAKRA